MYDHLIIDEIKKRRRQEEEDKRPQLELPLPEPNYTNSKKDAPEEKRVIIIDTMDEDDEFTFDL